MNKEISLKGKTAISVLCIWTFIHTYFLINNIFGYWITTPSRIKVIRLNNQSFNPVDYFYPFTYNESPSISNFEIRLYDYSEYFVYVGGVWMIYFLYRYLKGNKVQ